MDYSSSESEAEAEKVCTNKKAIRKIYSLGQKKKVADYARFHGVRAASRHFGVHHKNVSRWMKNRVEKIKNPNERKNKKGQGRKVSYPQDIEEKLVAWLLEKREENFVAISTRVIRLKAMSLIKPILPDFKASDGWVRRFMKRNSFVLRARTHISQKLPKDLEKKIEDFRAEVKQIYENSDYPLHYICNMDETPVYLDLLPSKVVDKKGKKSIRVRTTASEKNRITTVLCCTASGKLLPPLVIFKGKTLRPLKKVQVPDGVYCCTQAKAWMDEKRMIDWIDKVWSPHVAGKPALLSIDTFSAHFTDKVKEAFAKCNTKLLTIPGGCTSVLQPLDISLNKPFKSYIRQLWCQRMVDEAEKGTASKIAPASKTQLLEWIKTASDLINKNTESIKKSFEVAGIIDGSDQRNDAAYADFNRVMEGVFGEGHMGYVQPSASDDDDPFAGCSDSESDEDTAAACSDDPFSDGAGSFSDLSEISDIED